METDRDRETNTHLPRLVVEDNVGLHNCSWRGEVFESDAALAVPSLHQQLLLNQHHRPVARRREEVKERGLEGKRSGMQREILVCGTDLSRTSTISFLVSSTCPK